MKKFFSFFNIGQGLLIIALTAIEFFKSMAYAVEKPLEAASVSFGHTLLHTSLHLALGGVGLVIIMLYIAGWPDDVSAATHAVCVLLSAALFLATLLMVPGIVAAGSGWLLAAAIAGLLLFATNTFWCIWQIKTAE